MQPDCLISDLEIPDPKCPMTPWSDWSPCSATCGKGVQIRTRLLLVEPQREVECRAKGKELNQQRECATRQDCTFDYETAKDICSQEADAGVCRGSYRRFFYNPQRQGCEEFVYGGCRGNQNNFLTRDICMSTCGIIKATFSHSNRPISTTTPATTLRTTRKPIQVTTNGNAVPVDCVLSDWSDWSECSVPCGKIVAVLNVIVCF